MGVWTGTLPTFAAGEKVRASKLQTLSDAAAALTSAWVNWTPTLTALTVGSGTRTSVYSQANKIVDFYFLFIFGAGSAVGTDPKFTLPVTPASFYNGTLEMPFNVTLLDSGTGNRQGSINNASGLGTAAIRFWNATPTLAGITSTTPWTWATGDSIEVSGRYVAA